MAELKTQPHDGDVEAFLHGVSHEQRRADALRILDIMQEITGEAGQMWGPSMIGFGSYHYRYASGREGDWFQVGFSPRKQNLSLYIMPGFDRYEDLLAKLGKHKTGKSCLYINKLSDVDESVLREMIAHSVAYMREKYG
jgi:hypothetical protein